LVRVTGSGVSTGTQDFETDPSTNADDSKASTGPENIIAIGHGSVGAQVTV